MIVLKDVQMLYVFNVNKTINGKKNEKKTVYQTILMTQKAH